ncbi:hypothetical protein GCM10010112_73450 [Actinoplanes lobatus]|nr:hypothetical protein GCM10010112_73450 [Actinoplanes lobatus]
MRSSVMVRAVAATEFSWITAPTPTAVVAIPASAVTSNNFVRIPRFRHQRRMLHPSPTRSFRASVRVARALSKETDGCDGGG